EIALRILDLVVDRRRQLAVADCEQRENRLDRPGCAATMPGRSLRRGDGRLARALLAECHLDHARLARVAERRRRSVRVDVVDLRGIDPGVTECITHRTRGIFTSRVGLRDVRRVGGEPVAGDLRVDLRAARLCMLELLEYDDAARLAHHEPLALAVERTTRPLRIV